MLITQYDSPPYYSSTSMLSDCSDFPANTEFGVGVCRSGEGMCLKEVRLGVSTE